MKVFHTQIFRVRFSTSTLTFTKKTVIVKKKTSVKQCTMIISNAYENNKFHATVFSVSHRPMTPMTWVRAMIPHS